jgi:type IV pilus assembly protein PilV
MNMLYTSSVSSSHTRGFSLVEALVALVVLSVGMLGIAALYVESLRSGRTALTRTQAVTLVGDMADRIRANSDGANTYSTIVTREDTNTACAAGGGGCTSAQLALHDKAEWIGAIEDALPGAVGTIDHDNTTTPATYTITVTWKEAGRQADGKNNEDNSYVLRIQA